MFISENMDGDSCLREAASSNKEMDHINCLSSNGELALNVALRNRNYERLFKVLFNYAAYTPDPDLTDAEGKTAFDICDEVGLTDVSKKLETYRKGAQEEAEYQRQKRLLENCDNDEQRFSRLRWAAKDAFRAGRVSEAKTHAEELQKLTPQFKEDEYYGSAIHDYNIVLGRVAVHDGQIEQAKHYLIEAAKTPDPAPLKDFGPDLGIFAQTRKNIDRLKNRLFWGSDSNGTISYAKNQQALVITVNIS